MNPRTCSQCGKKIEWRSRRSAWVHTTPTDHAPIPPRFVAFEEDDDAPDDGMVLIAGVLYDAETGEEA